MVDNNFQIKHFYHNLQLMNSNVELSSTFSRRFQVALGRKMSRQGGIEVASDSNLSAAICTQKYYITTLALL